MATNLVQYDAKTGQKLAAGATTTDALGNVYKQGEVFAPKITSAPKPVAPTQPSADVVAMTNAQRAALGQGYSTIPGEFNSATGQRTATTAPATPYNFTQNPYESQYKSLLGQSSEELNAQKAINEQQDAFRQGIQKIEDKPIAMDFIRGQQQSLENRNINRLLPLQAQLALAQQKRQASLDAVKFGLERADKSQERTADEAYRYASLNKPSSSASDPYREISPGASLYNTETNQAVYTAPKTYAPTSNTPSTTQQKTLLTNTLNTGIAPNGTKLGNARGADGYVDPYVYLEAFKQWTGTPSQFLTAFPVKTNVNPLSYNLLPAAIKPSTSGRTI